MKNNTMKKGSKSAVRVMSLVSYSNAQDVLIALLFLTFLVFFFNNLRSREYAKIEYSQSQIALYNENSR